jgi:TonB family protein
MMAMEEPQPDLPGVKASPDRFVSTQGMHHAVALLALAFMTIVLLTSCGGGEVDGPTPLYGEIPIEYPLDLWDADVEGETLLRVRVTEEGAVDSVEVVEASGYPAFDSAAVRGALRLQYDPARRNGNRISVWAKVPVQFSKGGP